MTNEAREDLENRLLAAQKRGQARADALVAEELQQDTASEECSSPFAQKAQETGARMTAFAKEHPMALVAGGLAIGIAISALFPNSPTRKLGRRAGSHMALAKDKASAAMLDAKDKASERSSALSAIAMQAAVSFGQHLLETFEDARETGKEKLGEAGGMMSQARKTASGAIRQAGKAVKQAGKDIN